MAVPSHLAVGDSSASSQETVVGRIAIVELTTTWRLGVRDGTMPPHGCQCPGVLLLAVAWSGVSALVAASNAFFEKIINYVWIHYH